MIYWGGEAEDVVAAGLLVTPVAVRARCTGGTRSAAYFIWCVSGWDAGSG